MIKNVIKVLWKENTSLLLYTLNGLHSRSTLIQLRLYHTSTPSGSSQHIYNDHTHIWHHLSVGNQTSMVISDQSFARTMPWVLSDIPTHISEAITLKLHNRNFSGSQETDLWLLRSGNAQIATLLAYLHLQGNQTGLTCCCLCSTICIFSGRSISSQCNWFVVTLQCLFHQCTCYVCCISEVFSGFIQASNSSVSIIVQSVIQICVSLLPEGVITDS